MFSAACLADCVGSNHSALFVSVVNLGAGNQVGTPAERVSKNIYYASDLPCSGSLVLIIGSEVIVEFSTALRVLALPVEGHEEADNEDSDEDPEDAAHVEVGALVLDEFVLVGVVAGEEHGPGAHEQVGADERGCNHDERHAEVDGKDAANDGHEAGEDPESPDGVPSASHARDESIEEGATEEAGNESKKAEHHFDVPSDEAASDDSESEADEADCDASTNGLHPSEGETEHADNDEDEECDERGNDVWEPSGAEDGNKWASDEVDDADNPLVLVEPADAFHGEVLEFVISITRNVFEIEDLGGVIER